MIKIFRKIWNFSDKEQKNIKNSIFFGCLNAIFNAFQFGAVYFVLLKVFNETLNSSDPFIVFSIMLVSAVGKVLTQNKSQLMQTHAGYFMSADKRINIGEKLKKVPMGFFSDLNLGKITALATTSLNQIEMWVPMLLVLVLGGILTTLVFILSLFFFNSKVAFIALCGMVVFFFVTSFMEKKSRKNAIETNKTQELLTGEVLSTIQGMQVIKTYNLGGENNKKLNSVFEDACNNTLNMEKLIIPYIVLQRIVIGITISCMLYFSINMYISGEIILPDAIMTMIASFIIFEGLMGAGSNMAILRIAENAIDSLEYINSIPDIKEGKIGETIKDFNIDFDKVSFAYDKNKILNNVSCEIKEKTMTAVVGPSGSGKTTFCNLIARFWDVNSGSIMIGGKDVSDYTISNLMQNISFVFQDVYLFNDTIENNIKFGTYSATIEDVIKASKQAQCHDFIVSLPDGYNTIIGEGGASISGGEKQRISIARAILKDASIVIFDEATASVDPENEDKLQYAIEALTKDKTIIMIAHRLKTIRNADQILVLNKGNIEQSGTHEELMDKGGLYKRYIEMKKKTTNWKLSN